ncbi:MAG TPA: hypothetical protein VH542_05910, partial [Steroidobacteraceae bacterium]
MTYTAGAPGSTGVVQLMATQTDGPAKDSGWINVNVNNTYGVTVRPLEASPVIPPGTATAPVFFTVTNTGSSMVEYSLAARCGLLGTVGCSVPSSVTVGAGGAANVEVDVDVATYGSAFAVQLLANDDAHGTSANGSANVTTGTYTVGVSPNSAAINAEGNTSGAYTFTVSNGGNLNATYSLSATCSTSLLDGGAGLSNCAAPASVSVNSLSSQQVTVTFNTLQPGDSGKVRLTASASGTSSQGEVAVVLNDHRVGVSLAGGSPSVEPGAYTYPFTVTNTGNVYNTYNLSAACTLDATGCPASLSPVGPLAPGASTTV